MLGRPISAWVWNAAVVFAGENFDVTRPFGLFSSSASSGWNRTPSHEGAARGGRSLRIGSGFILMRSCSGPLSLGGPSRGVVRLGLPETRLAGGLLVLVDMNTDRFDRRLDALERPMPDSFAGERAESALYQAQALPAGLDEVETKSLVTHEPCPDNVLLIC